MQSHCHDLWHAGGSLISSGPPTRCAPLGLQLSSCKRSFARSSQTRAGQRRSTRCSQTDVSRQVLHTPNCPEGTNRRQLLLAAGVQLAFWQACQHLQSATAADSLVVEGPNIPSDGSGPIRLPSIPSEVKQVRMSTLQDSALSVAIYPEFEYNALGGGGVAQAELYGNHLNIKFDAAKVNIPNVSAKTAKWLGVPMLPGTNIAVSPIKLEGFIDKDTGEVAMDFVAEFNFSAYKFYKAPPLFVDTHLTTEEVRGSIRSGHGRRMNDKGIARLVGVATVPKTNDIFLDKFLMLPTETFATMSSQFTFS